MKLPAEEEVRQLKELDWVINHPEYKFKPVDIRTFIESPYYLDMKEDTWESVKAELTDFYSRQYQEAVLDKAIGSGKSFWTSIVICHEAYKLGCFHDARKALGQARNARIAIMNMAPREAQARDIIFGSVLTLIEKSPWFQTHMLFNPHVRSRLEFPQKGIYIIPGNSSETFPTGYNIKVAIMDECAWYVQTDTKDAAENIYNSLKRRLTSRFGKEGLLVMISSPRYVDDFIERKMKEAMKNPNMFHSRKALWDMKPGYDLTPAGTFQVQTGGEVHRVPKVLEEDYIRNPEKFIRDFMAMPNLALEPYIKDAKAIDAMFRQDIRNIWNAGMLRLDRLAPKTPCWVHADLGLNKDKAALAMVTREADMVIGLLLMQIAGSKKEGRDVDFSEIRDIIVRLKYHGFNIVGVSYDGWQSIDSKQILQKKGFDVSIISMDRTLEPYDTLKGLILEGKVIVPIFDPLKQELKRLELIKGKKVDHPRNGSKDIADALCGAVFNSMQTMPTSPAFLNQGRVFQNSQVRSLDRVLV